jgi:predicted RNase H-like HicB family nuclease
MQPLFYPAVLERGEGEAYAVWFPDFPDVVVGDVTQHGAMAKAEAVLAEAAEELALQGRAMPAASDLDGFELPDDCDLVSRFAVRVTPPDLSERVNVYLPKSLIERVDARASAMGMSRSSFFGWALTVMLGPRAAMEASRKAGK